MTNKLDAVAFLYEHGSESVISRKPIAMGVLVHETPLTDLNKAQERIDRLEERVAELERELDRAAIRDEHYASMLAQCFEGDEQ